MFFLDPTCPQAAGKDNQDQMSPQPQRNETADERRRAGVVMRISPHVNDVGVGGRDTERRRERWRSRVYRLGSKNRKVEAWNFIKLSCLINARKIKSAE